MHLESHTKTSVHLLNVEAKLKSDSESECIQCKVKWQLPLTFPNNKCQGQYHGQQKKTYESQKRNFVKLRIFLTAENQGNIEGTLYQANI